MSSGLVLPATAYQGWRNTDNSPTSPSVSRQQTIPSARVFGRAGAAVIAAGIAAGLVAAVTAYALATWLADLAVPGIGAIAAVVVLIVPIAGTVTLVIPFTAGAMGGIVAARPVGAIGSVGGVLVGLWTGSALAGSAPLQDVTAEGLVVLLAVLAVVTIIGHLTGSGLRLALRRR